MGKSLKVFYVLPCAIRSIITIMPILKHFLIIKLYVPTVIILTAYLYAFILV